MATTQNFLKLVANPCDATIDIVAVHGLNPKNTDLHAEKTWTSERTNKLWLRDFLPSEATYTRIFIFGYNSNVAFETSNAGLSEHAGNLLNLVSLERKKSPQRPLIFICHSLGGLVVKEALIQSKLNRIYNDIGTSTYGIVFFGTPHRGGENAKLGAFVSNVFRAVLGNPNNTFMDALIGKSSPFSDDLVQKFQHLAQDYSILSFYETRPMGRLGMIVDRHSATLGSGANEKQIPIDADHRQMCKFASDQDPAYTQVCRNILELLQDAGNSKTPLKPTAHSLSAKEQACLRSLWFPEMNNRFHDIKNALSNTCQWLYTSSAFEEWERSKNSILWIKGHPGTGKSTLVKSALQHCPKDIISASYFFSHRGVQLQHTLEGCFQSLLHQILPQAPTQLMKISLLYEERCKIRGKFGEKWRWHESELKTFFRETIRGIAGSPIRLFIDALDEGGEESALELIQEFQAIADQIMGTESSLLVLFSRRHYPIIASDGLIIEMEKENSGDLTKYVQHQFVAGSINSLKAEALTTTILEKANGNFQWIALVLPKVINECRRGKSMDSLQGIIRKLPSKLHDLYQSLLTEISQEDRPQALRLFRWALFAMRSLRVSEMRHAILVDQKCPYKSFTECVEQQDHADSDAEMEQRIIDLSRGLLTIKEVGSNPKGEISSPEVVDRDESDDETDDGEADDDESDDNECDETDEEDPTVEDYGQNERFDNAPGQRVVKIIHGSVFDYLISENGLGLLYDDQVVVSSAQEHVRLAWVCARYMFMKETFFLLSGLNCKLLQKQAWNKIASFYPFLSYAVRFWINHVAASENDIAAHPELFELFLCLSYPSHEQMKHWQPVICSMAGNSVMFVPLQHVLAWIGMRTSLEELLEATDIDINAKDFFDRTPMHYAASGRQADTLKMLLDREDIDANIPDKNGRTPVFYVGMAI